MLRVLNLESVSPQCSCGDDVFLGVALVVSSMALGQCCRNSSFALDACGFVQEPVLEAQREDDVTASMPVT